jgi:AcrR family transcriptional regulator
VVEAVDINQQLLIPTGRHTLPPQEVRERQRERLLRAIASCVSEQGYADTTIADVVRIARTSRTAFYEHFSDKESAFLEAYQQMTAAFIKASLDAAASVTQWQAKLEAGIATYLRWMAEHPEVAITTIVEIHSAGRRGLEARSRALKQWTRTLEGVATLARRDRADLPELDDAVYYAIILTAEMYVHDYARRGCVEQVEEKTPHVQGLARSLFQVDAASI